ncbi:MAG TPA: ABC transporter permease [Anaerolineaceae bacterium]|nr:ABC transporter permease [Anaerolineaceae bacterium]
MKSIDLALKDFKRSIRSLFAIGMLFVAPLLITGLIYFAFGGMQPSGGEPASIPDFNVLVVNLDEPPAGGTGLGEELVKMLNDERLPAWLVVNPAADEPTARQAVDRQQAGAAVVIPADFTAQLMQPDGQTELRILHDPTLTVGPAVLRMLIGQFTDGVTGSQVTLAALDGALEGAGSELTAERRQAALQAYQDWFVAFQQDLNHGEGRGLEFRGPGSAPADGANPMQAVMGQIVAGMLIFFVFFGGASAAQSILQESEEGTLARLFTTPTARASILNGKFLYVLALVTVQALVLMLLASLLFHIEWGQPLAVALVVLGLVVCAAGFGIFVISLLRSSRQAGPVVGGVFSATGMMGGLISAAVPMPAAFKMVQKLVPQGWAFDGWSQVLAGSSAADVLPTVLVMLVLGAIFFALGLSKFQRRFA